MHLFCASGLEVLMPFSFVEAAPSQRPYKNKFFTHTFQLTQSIGGQNVCHYLSTARIRRVTYKIIWKGEKCKIVNDFVFNWSVWFIDSDRTPNIKTLKQIGFWLQHSIRNKAFLGKLDIKIHTLQCNKIVLYSWEEEITEWWSMSLWVWHYWGPGNATETQPIFDQPHHHNNVSN